MRSALICVFFALLVRRGSRADNDFRPTPIPLNEWHYDRRDARAGTLHETIRTDAPPSVAAVPAHYWEDALRHSVYLTLVRDKIDQLIAKGEVISPDSKPDQYVSKDIDDHDLWEKIKTAPFDRVQEDEPAALGDVTIMAIGRLMEERNGYRFTEDDRSKEKCKDDKCMDGVKAFWSVKRVRQREVETSPGKYHYELTFSVSSQHPKKQKKPHENPVRTFTVKETSPDQALDMPQEHRTLERLRILPPGHPTRPTRAIWFHKNIVPTQGRQYTHGLDRIFSSFFSDDDDDYEPPRYRPHVQPTPAQYPQYSKMGYVGSPSDQQKRLTPYPYRPHVYKYTRPLGPPPPYQQHTQHHFVGSVETDSAGHSYQDFRFGPPAKPIRTTRPAVLPTPLPPVSPTNRTESDSVKQTTQIVKQNVTEAPIIKTTDVKTIHKTVHKIRPGPMKINYLPDHVRPPIYNAPPGVFVTMDKKPFKPMPPLKFINKPIKYKPIDFRPSPQVLDMQQFSEPDPQQDTAFRPITWNYAETSTTEKPEKEEVAESSTQVNKTRKTTQKGKKPPKKHENIQPSRATTNAPEIITASSDSAEESDAMQWANVVGAFSKTTPMASEKKSEVTESISPTTTTTSTTTTVTTTTAATTAALKRRTTTTTEAPAETTTTQKPRTKRTRPPPKFAKPDKLKKHKRITTTTTKAPEVKTTQDLTPQASSAAASKPAKPSTTTSTAKPTTTTTTTTTTRPTTTTTRPTTTTTKSTTTTTQSPKPASKDSVSTTQPKIKNRFRQSTLMQKGTSVNHDKWTAPTSPDKSKTTGPGGNLKPLNTRRKGSNFHGYVSSTTPRNEQEYEKFHEDKGPSKAALTVKPLATTTPSYEETADQYENNGESSDYTGKGNENFEDEPSGNEEQESRDHSEYIFQPSTTPSERTNEVDAEPITTEQIITSPLSAPKNKTKCKKKKTQNSTTTEEVEVEESIQDQTSVLPITTTTEVSTPSIFEELFGSFTVGDSVEDQNASPTTSKPDLQEQGSEKHGQFVKLDDDLQDFLDSLERDGRDVDVEEEYEDDEESEPVIDEDEEFSDDDDSPSARDISQDYEKYEPVDDYKRPYSLLELMAMD